MKTRSLITPILALCAIACAQAQTDFTLPAIPDSIADPMERANYLGAHYWDDFDPQSPVASDSAAMERAFADYAWLLMAADSIDYQPMEQLISRANTEPKIYGQLCEYAHKYLYQPDSPVENLMAYAAFLRATASTDSILGTAEHQRREFMLESIEAVLPPNAAPDFDLSDGRSIKDCLSAPFCLLVFYDHDCEECQHLLADIEKSAYLGMLVDDGVATVIRVDVTLDDTDPRVDDYLMRAVPSIYLLKQDGSIVLPDTSLKKALAMIAAAQLAANAETIGF